MKLNELYRQLSLVDWDFIEQRPLDIPAIHWYPGSFAPGLPGVLIELLSQSGDTIFDPFCGVGSASAAALLRGRNSISCDLNPVGVMSGLTTTGLLSLVLNKHELFERVLDDIHIILNEIHSGNALFNTFSDPDLVDEHITLHGGASINNVFSLLFKTISVTNLRKWYHSKTLSELQRFLEYLERAPISRFSKIIGYTMLSAIARSTSSETRSWGHIADNVMPREYVYKDVKRAASLWLHRTRKYLLAVRFFAGIPSRDCKFAFSVTDWTKPNSARASDQASLLLTSPPYGGAIDYSLAQRLTFYLMGTSEEDISNLVGAEIGARRKRFRPAHIETWADQLAEALYPQLTFVSKKGYLAYVMPHKDHGRDAGETKMREMLATYGWELWFRTDRSVRQSRTRQSWTSIKKETVLIFRRRK